MNNTQFEIVLIGVGATAYDREGRVQGTLDVPLCPESKFPISQVVEGLRGKELTVVYSAPCQAAQETAKAIALELKIKKRLIEKLTNVDLGLWQGKLLAEIKTQNPKVYRQWQEHPETVRPPQGETLEEAKKRVEIVIAKLSKRHSKGGRVGLVVPEPLASVFRNVLRKDVWIGFCPSNGEIPYDFIPVPAAIYS